MNPATTTIHTAISELVFPDGSKWKEHWIHLLDGSLKKWTIPIQVILDILNQAVKHVAFESLNMIVLVDNCWSPD